MRIHFAHIRHPSTTGTPINFAVFGARSNSGTDRDNSAFLSQLTAEARAHQLQVDQSALAYEENGQLRFYGDRHLVDFLSKNGLPRWTNFLDL